MTFRNFTNSCFWGRPVNEKIKYRIDEDLASFIFSIWLL
jgi:hypothetical protein